MTRNRLLIVGWDGATYDLLRPWMQAGDLPVLSRLIDTGAHATLDAFPNMNSAVAWTSIVTGCNPGKHGIFDFGELLARGDKTLHIVTALDRQKHPFWTYLSAAGKRVGIVNVPISYPVERFDGFMLSGMDAPGIDYPDAQHPPGLVESLAAAGIDYVLDVPNLGELRRRDPYRLPKIVRDMVERRTQTLLYMMRQADWDTLMVVYIATDRMQHNFWGETAVPPSASTAASATAPTDTVEKSWQPLRDLYRLMDQELGRLIDAAGRETTVVVLSDHSFGPSSTSRGLLLNQLFARLGLLTFRRDGRPTRQRLFTSLLTYGRRYLPPRLQYELAKRFPRWRNRILGERNYGNLDWTRTQLWAHRSGAHIFVNLEDRFHHGIVPLADHGALCERVQSVFLGLTDPATNRPLLTEARRRDEIYHGPQAERSPDLIVDWDPGIPSYRLLWSGGPEPIRIEVPARAAPGKAGHQRNGIFVVNGPTIRPGATLDPIRQYDVAPTLLHLQGHPIPTDMDGRVLTELFDAETLRRAPVTTMSADAAAPVPTSPLSDADAALVEQRLRDLGYL